TYSQRDIVLGKVKGYPAWPAMIVDPGLVPATVQIERPTATKTTFYCVQFFPAGDYSWLAPKDISRLLPHEIESYLNEPAKKRQDLFAAYQVA
ncbi:Tudor/PWWP/MBT, partial [Fistulina hepatica ATCC 64428]